MDYISPRSVVASDKPGINLHGSHYHAQAAGILEAMRRRLRVRGGTDFGNLFTGRRVRLDYLFDQSSARLFVLLKTNTRYPRRHEESWHHD